VFLYAILRRWEVGPLFLYYGRACFQRLLTRLDIVLFFSAYSTLLSGTDHGKCIARMFAGDTFGDKALNTDNPRSATIVAQEKSELIALERSDYQMFSKLDLLFSPKRCLDALRIAPHNRSPAEVEYVRVQPFFFFCFPAVSLLLLFVGSNSHMPLVSVVVGLLAPSCLFQANAQRCFAGCSSKC
jgi:hypothetical protein